LLPLSQFKDEYSAPSFDLKTEGEHFCDAAGCPAFN